MLKTKRYANVNEAMAFLCLEFARDGQDVPVKNAVGDLVSTKEIADYHLSFAPNYNNIITLKERKFPVKGSQAEFLWYMTANDKAEVVAKFLPNWLKFTDENGLVNSNYGSYWHERIPNIIDILKRDKTSRRAVMNIYNDDDAPFGKDTPCTLTLQFLIRNNQLNMIVNMRSNDIWHGLSIDQYCNSMLHQLVYNSLLKTYPDLQIGWYDHNAGSMHVYMSDSSGNATIPMERLGKMFNEWANEHPEGYRHTLPTNVTFENFWSEITENEFKPELIEHFKQFIIQ